MTSFKENLRGAYGGGEGANGTEGHTRQGRGRRACPSGSRAHPHYAVRALVPIM
jgi:hypothetical protein